VTREEWDAYWLWRDTFIDVIDQQYYPIEWLDGLLLADKAFFVFTDNAAAIYEIKNYPSGVKDVHGLVCAGDLCDIQNTLIPAAREHGRSLGCIGFLIESRPGWVKALKSDGFELFQASVRAPI